MNLDTDGSKRFKRSMHHLADLQTISGTLKMLRTYNCLFLQFTEAVQLIKNMLNASLPEIKSGITGWLKNCAAHLQNFLKKYGSQPMRDFI